jgi:hypothetical protein
LARFALPDSFREASVLLFNRIPQQQRELWKLSQKTPVVDRRTRIIAKLEEQKALSANPNLQTHS